MWLDSSIPRPLISHKVCELVQEGPLVQQPYALAGTRTNIGYDEFVVYQKNRVKMRYVVQPVKTFCKTTLFRIGTRCIGTQLRSRILIPA